MNLNIFTELPEDLENEIFNSISEEKIESLFSVIKTLLKENSDLKPEFESKEINLFFVEDSEIQDLNHTFRDKDKPTDCLSFPSYEEEDFLPTFWEVFIAVPYIQKQAEEYWVTLDFEISKMLIHSILHLFGYDHVKEKDFKKMNSLEEKIMSAWKSV